MVTLAIARRLSHAAFLIGACLKMLWRDRCPPSWWHLEIANRLALRLPSADRTMWVHGEGVGEFKAAEPVLSWLQSSCPEHRLLLTTSRLQTLCW
ncbi:MAG: glycosyltransferase N-terminal domain-containing protein, partial [Gemmataceae bacterium]